MTEKAEDNNIKIDKPIEKHRSISFLIGIVNLILLGVSILIFFIFRHVRSPMSAPIILPFFYCMFIWIPTGIGTICGIFEIFKYKFKAKDIIGFMLNATLLTVYIVLITLLLEASMGI